jgi:hypothetical protein
VIFMKNKMKRIISLFLSVAMLITTLFALQFTTFGATAGTCGNSATWSYDSKTTTLTISGTGATNDYNALISRSPWLNYKSEITKIVVEEGITEIGNYNFYNCVALTSVSLPSTLVSIDGTGTMETSYGAFQNCTSLVSITLPKNLQTIETCAFKGCSALKSITFPDSLTSIGYAAFCDCTALTTVNFGDGLTETGLNTFYNCTSIKKIDWGNSITKISAYSFYGYGGTELNFPDTISSIGFRSFANNYYLRKVTINNSNCVISTTLDTEVSSPFAGHEQDSVTIYGHKGSTAEDFATQFSYPFISIDPCDHEETYDKVTVEATCVSTGVKSTICSNCNQVVRTAEISATGHKYETIETVDQTDVDGHIYTTQKCTVCGDINDVVTHQTLENGETTYVWIDGYYTYTNTATCTRAGYERYVCTVEGCSQTENHVARSSHTVTEWTVTKSPTCTEEGTQEGVCDVCGETVTESIAKTDHYYEDADLLESIDTTEEDGHIHNIYTCQNCNEQIDVTTHVEWIEGFYTPNVISEAHCVIDGLERDTCTICGETRNVVLEANGEHDWYETSTTEPTCTATGKIYYACTNCTMTKYENIDALGHDYVLVPDNSKAATCTETGYDYYKCSRCSATKQETVAKVGHTVDKYDYTVIAEPTCEDAGSAVSTCTVCGEQFTKTLDALGHNYVDVTVDLTSENKPGHSLVTPTCSRCGSTKSSSMTHSEWIDGYYTTSDGVSPACATQGYTRDTCSICGTVRRNPIPALGHMYYYSGLNDSEGKMIYTCSICHASTESYFAYEIMQLWDEQYVNKKPSRTAVDNTSYLDANGDNIINAKDYAILRNGIRTYNTFLAGLTQVNISVNNNNFVANLYDKTATTNLLALLPQADLEFEKTADCYYYSTQTFDLTVVPSRVTEVTAGEIYCDSDGHLYIVYANATLKESKYLAKIGFISDTGNLGSVFDEEGDDLFTITAIENNAE